MFWKKSEPVDVTLITAHNDNRSAYRIAPDEKRPVIVSIKGQDYPVCNVSGTGFAFRSTDFDVEFKSRAILRLPSENRVFSVMIEVIAKQGELCRCCFTEIHEDAENLLHSYILDLQKAKIRQKRR